ncbi:MAG TPA: WhiB family transcriptional regulator [Actinomycetota bacterium]|nr:WhiB family transcriptional regulator [Actinomycetota bacterium]
MVRVISIPEAFAPTDDDDPWWLRSLCGTHDDPDLFFDPTRITEAKAVCARCPVRRPCADANAVAEGTTGKAHWHGVVAGETANARRRHAKSVPR